jgi:DICT domain-containing protein
MRTIDYLEREKVEQLSKAPAKTPAAKDTIFVGSAFFMSKFTRIVEDEIIKEKLSGGHLYVDFQILSRFLKKVERYGEIAELANAVTVYGAGDDKIPEDAFYTPVRLKRDDSLVSSWFIVYSNGRKRYALVAVEKKLRARDIQGRSRTFRGFWSTKRSIVEYLIDYLERVVNVQYGVEGGAR